MGGSCTLSLSSATGTCSSRTNWIDQVHVRSPSEANKRPAAHCRVSFLESGRAVANRRNNALLPLQPKKMSRRRCRFSRKEGGEKLTFHFQPRCWSASFCCCYWGISTFFVVVVGHLLRSIRAVLEIILPGESCRYVRYANDIPITCRHYHWLRLNPLPGRPVFWSFYRRLVPDLITFSSESTETVALCLQSQRFEEMERERFGNEQPC